MEYSEKLDGFWEEGYHYYLEIHKDRLTVRQYRRKVILETGISYNADALERGERTVIALQDNVLSRQADGSMMMEIRELAYAHDELEFLEYYTIMGEKRYTLKKVNHGPFDHIRIRDEEFLPRLQGKWIEWSPAGGGNALVIRDRQLSWRPFGGGAFHAVSYEYAPEKVYLVPEDLTENSFPGFTAIEVSEDMLTTRMIITDMNVPLTVFARKGMLDKISIPPAALERPRSTMVSTGPAMNMPFRGMGMYDGTKRDGN